MCVGGGRGGEGIGVNTTTHLLLVLILPCIKINLCLTVFELLLIHLLPDDDGGDGPERLRRENLQ